MTIKDNQVLQVPFQLITTSFTFIRTICLHRFFPPIAHPSQPNFETFFSWYIGILQCTQMTHDEEYSGKNATPFIIVSIYLNSLTFVAYRRYVYIFLNVREHKWIFSKISVVLNCAFIASIVWQNVEIFQYPGDFIRFQFKPLRKI